VDNVLSNPMGLAVLAGAGLVIHRLVVKHWLRERPVVTAPISRQLGPGRRVAPRPMRSFAARPSPKTTAQPTSGSTIGDRYRLQ
jgi:hypothetical protein